MDYKDFYLTVYAPKHETVPSGNLALVWDKMVLERQEAVFRFLGEGERFLDIGCGFGKLVFQATQKYEEVYGVDISEERISWSREAAEKLDGAKIKFDIVDIDSGLPYEEGYFDAVSCVATLEFVIEPLNLLREAYRVLKRGAGVLGSGGVLVPSCFAAQVAIGVAGWLPLFVIAFLAG